MNANRYLSSLLWKTQKKSARPERNHQTAHRSELSQTDELTVVIVLL